MTTNITLQGDQGFRFYHPDYKTPGEYSFTNRVVKPEKLYETLMELQRDPTLSRFEPITYILPDGLEYLLFMVAFDEYTLTNMRKNKIIFRSERRVAVMMKLCLVSTEQDSLLIRRTRSWLREKFAFFKF